MISLVYRKTKTALILSGLGGWLIFNYSYSINSCLQMPLELSVAAEKLNGESCLFFAFRIFWGRGHFLLNHGVVIYTFRVRVLTFQLPP